jgi:hypothetical protein
VENEIDGNDKGNTSRASPCNGTHPQGMISEVSECTGMRGVCAVIRDDTLTTIFPH